ncbi:MAG TPA: metal-dependent transcriptional regulator [Thermoplasmatales archaeon]|nr:metal-dependent transcriptional regulator [Thermoplasmatales archaeon]
MVTTRIEQYIEAIHEIVKKKGYARVKDVSESVGVGFSAVSEMFSKLSEKGYINYEKHGWVTLTKKGEKLATKLSKRHKVLRDFFIILGIDEKVADEDACEIEHVVRKETMDRLTKFVEFVKSHEDPLWLKRFKEYYETGKLPECPRTIKKTKIQSRNN